MNIQTSIFFIFSSKEKHLVLMYTLWEEKRSLWIIKADGGLKGPVITELLICSHFLKSVKKILSL